jgi:hypothetical protein
MVSEGFDLLALSSTLIAALFGSFVGNLIPELIKRKSEKEKLEKDITDKYLIQLQYIIQSFVNRLSNLSDKGGADYMKRKTGDENYYILTTLYTLGSIFAYNKILLFEGVYSQINRIYSNFGRDLMQEIDKFGNSLDDMDIRDPINDRRIKFFRYHRMLLGDAVTERENHLTWIISYLQFKNLYEDKNEDKIRESLSYARLFIENLPSSKELTSLKKHLLAIIKMLEDKTQIEMKV